MKSGKISKYKYFNNLIAVFAAVFVTIALALPVMAAPLLNVVPITPENGEEFTVTFTKDGVMVDNFSSDTEGSMFNLSGLQPGDTAVLQIKVINEYSKDTDWYMLNAVLDSLEGKNKDGGENANANAKGGAYEYSLTYKGPGDAEAVDIFNSDTVGGTENGEVSLSDAGDDLEGLKSATNNLKDFFWFDNLKQDEVGTIELRIKLEGESIGNDYQDALADLQLQFAVEVPVEPTPTETTTEEETTTKEEPTPTETTTEEETTTKEEPTPSETTTTEPTTTVAPTTTAPTTVPPAPKPPAKGPNTGDNTGRTVLYLVIACVAALLIIMIVVLILKRKKAAAGAPDGDDREDRS